MVGSRGGGIGDCLGAAEGRVSQHRVNEGLVVEEVHKSLGMPLASRYRGTQVVRDLDERMVEGVPGGS